MVHECGPKRRASRHLGQWQHNGDHQVIKVPLLKSSCIVPHGIAITPMNEVNHGLGHGVLVLVRPMVSRC